MVKRLVIGLGLAALAFVQPGQAQQPAAPPAPAPNLPEKIPFGLPYGPSIDLDTAKTLIAAVEAEAKKRGWFFNITVVDPHGDLLAFERMDDAQYASIAIAQNKARTAARWRRETAVFYKSYEAGHTFYGTLDPLLTASPGGIPLVKDGKIVGAIGCSGGTGDQDALVCKMGADALK